MRMTVILLLAGLLGWAGVTLGTKPCPSLQRLLDDAPAGAVVKVPACVYREAVTITKPLTLDGGGVAEIRGSEVWDTGWIRESGRWVHGGAPLLPKSYGTCRPGTVRCQWPEQVFLDGQPLVQVASAPDSGQFSVTDGRVVLADDPTGRLVEVTTRSKWVVIASDYVTIRGFTMKHSGSPAQYGGIQAAGFSHLTLERNVLSDAHGLLVSIRGGSHHQILQNDLARGGNHAGGANGATDVLVRGNRFHHHNTEDFSPGWEASGTKNVGVTRFTFEDNEVDHNGGPGVWCDIGCADVRIANNFIHHNEHDGIFFEISDRAVITGNTVWANGWGDPRWCYGAGILASSSSDVEISGNIVAWNARGISALSQDRPPYNPAMHNVVVHDNLVTQDADTPAIVFCEDWTDEIFRPEADNRGWRNQVWYPDAEGAYGRFSWGGRTLRTLDEFNVTPGGGGTSAYMTDQEKAGLLLEAGIEPSP
jgi:hypothetical protein